MRLHSFSYGNEAQHDPIHSEAFHLAAKEGKKMWHKKATEKVCAHVHYVTMKFKP